MKKLLILLAVIAGVALITIARSRLGSDQDTKVQVHTVEPRSIRSSILASGALAHGQQALLTSELVGKVTAINVQEGDLVKRGQLVLQIDDEAYAADVEQKQAQVRSQEIAIERAAAAEVQAERKLGRNRAIYDKRLVSADFIEEQKLSYDLNRIDLKLARSQLDLSREELRKSRNGLDKTRILSPLDGVVIAVDIKVGETAIPSVASIAGSELMTIADPASIYAKVYVDEADIANLKIGDKAEVVATSYPDRSVAGKVEHISTSARVAPGRQGLSFAVKISFDTPDASVLRPGVSCRAEIFVNSRDNVIAVPVKAVIAKEEQNTTKHHVFVLRDGTAQRVEVKTGISDDDYLEISSGLNAGDKVITGPETALQKLYNGAVVKVSDG